MKTAIPSTSDLRDMLKPFTLKQLSELSRLSDVPQATLYKIRIGQTPNPGIETVRKFVPHVKSALKMA